MAQRREIRLTDDITGRDLPTGQGETLTFALDGTTYEIDLGARNATGLRRTLAIYIAAGRRIPAAPRKTRKAPGADARTVKAWARTNGYNVNDRGRVPAAIRQAFDAAN